MPNADLGCNWDKAQREVGHELMEATSWNRGILTPVPEQLGQARGLFWIITSSPFHPAVATLALFSLEEGGLGRMEPSLRGCGASNIRITIYVCLVVNWLVQGLTEVFVWCPGFDS